MKVTELLFPKRCPFCGTVIGRKDITCDDCGGDLPVVPDNVCRICGVEKGLCACHKRSYPCARRVAPFYYEGPAKRGVLRFKKMGRFGGYRALARFTAQRVKAMYSDVTFDCVVCVPAGKRALKKRRFDQTKLLAREVARLLDLPFDGKLLTRLYDGLPQKGMSRTGRIGNVAGVFDLKDHAAASGKRFLLVDDVITTGATVNECAKMLRIFGATAVYAAAVCVGKPPPEPEKKK